MEGRCIWYDERSDEHVVSIVNAVMSALGYYFRHIVVLFMC